MATRRHAVATPLLVVADESLLVASRASAGGAALVTRGVLPVAAILIVCVAGYHLLRSQLGATRLEATQALFAFLTTAFVVLTATGIWFRGAGMRLVWPWRA
jgi:hypothetical protein